MCIVKIVPDCLSKFCDSSGEFSVLIRQELASVFVLFFVVFVFIFLRLKVFNLFQFVLCN